MKFKKFQCPSCGFTITDPELLPRRSNPENRYFHGVVIPIIAEHIGYSGPEMKEILKAKFLSETRVIDTIHGPEEIEYIKPTSSLNTVEFEIFLEKIRQWGSIELGVNIPLPNEETND